MVDGFGEAWLHGRRPAHTLGAKDGGEVWSWGEELVRPSGRDGSLDETEADEYVDAGKGRRFAADSESDAKGRRGRKSLWVRAAYADAVVY